TQLVSRHSWTYLDSLPLRSGSASGITRVGSAVARLVSHGIRAAPISVGVVPYPLDRLRETVLQAKLRAPAQQAQRLAVVGAQSVHLTRLGAHPRRLVRH